MSATPPPTLPPTQPGYLPELPGSTAGLVLGICSICLSFPVVGLILAFIGFKKSKEARALYQSNPTAYSSEGIAYAGYICSIVGLCIGGFMTFCGCGYFIFSFLVFLGMLGAAGAAGAAGLIY